VKLDSYESSRNNPNPNSVRITIDGSQVLSESFGNSFSRGFTFTDATKAHSWTVVVDAPGSQWDKTLSGTSSPCAPTTVADASAELSVTSATCSSPGSLVLGTVRFATWGTPSATTGPANYTVTATATKGHTFSDGKNTKSFTGSIPGTLDESKCIKPDASAEISTTDPSCSSPGTLVLGAIKNATWGTPTATRGPGNYSVTATATKGHSFGDGTTTKVFEGTLAGTLDPETLPCAETDADAQLASVPGTCDSPGLLTLGTLTNAVWGEPSTTKGPGDYSVTATANSGHLFSDGERTKTFRGTLEGTLDQTKAPCLPNQPQATIVVKTIEATDCVSKEIVTTITTTTTGSELNSTHTAWIPTTPVVKVSTSTRPADDLSACAGGGGGTGFAAGTPGTSLARTGVELGWGLGAAGLLAAIGAALVLYPRIRRFVVAA
jgi:hypothetical protein